MGFERRCRSSWQDYGNGCWCERTIWLKADTELIRRHKEVLRDATSKRGVRLVIILYGDDPEEFRFNDRCEIHLHEGNGFPMGFAVITSL